jgi:HD-GYP domain-containing protein (c-di-GMP phosphodiesterase class II)
MSSTQVLLKKIAALRERLARGAEAGAADVRAAPRPGTDSDSAAAGTLERKIAVGYWENSLLDNSLLDNSLPSPEAVPSATAVQPPLRLTARSARLLQRGRSLLQKLRRLADEPLLENRPLHPLARHYRETAAMIDALLRAVQAFPELPSAQVRLCDGLEAVLAVVAERSGTLGAALEQHHRHDARVDKVAELMHSLGQGQSVSLHSLQSLAEELLDEARLGQPLRFFHSEASNPVRFTACHGLVVAQVMARLVLDDSEWSGRPHEPVLAGLFHDVGMLGVPAEILNQPGPLNDEQRRLMESHTTAGAEMLRRVVPAKSWLVEAASEHHERCDGTGYPGGLREANLSALVRLVSVCDIYAALCAPRSYRAALETRTALTDTLLLAEQRALDRFQAEKLLNLSFYPPGSVVELSGGEIGLVVAAHNAKSDLRAPSRPILTMLVDSQGRFLPFPGTLDLLRCSDRSIMRSLLADERQELLGIRYPELV